MTKLRKQKPMQSKTDAPVPIETSMVILVEEVHFRSNGANVWVNA